MAKFMSIVAVASICIITVTCFSNQERRKDLELKLEEERILRLELLEEGFSLISMNRRDKKHIEIADRYSKEMNDLRYILYK